MSEIIVSVFVLERVGCYSISKLVMTPINDILEGNY